MRPSGLGGFIIRVVPYWSRSRLEGLLQSLFLYAADTELLSEACCIEGRESETALDGSDDNI